ncbi:uncharacterized protein MYCFIDRAFT_213586 [Pseudocercospora fijiensis CIRAD86]|uniref:Uncharacterized protein n=1 Tax=Pseudocercospora fijiensis (strain CIRAD86) TaxID=383855 RepID=N1Q8N2_PSEFD|nr:uncharacterized protein MYCFIDRAFT_213586 [Pseudocercospora fijiensis CIRAD86]EME89255.1 hypothetical protein MYCFIDRAFT_213586 [Pseudocercospora fijiensis CIRAD86]
MSTSPVSGDLEKQNLAVAGLKSDDHISQHAQGRHHHTARLRERLRQFVHPNGKKIHIAASPEEADQLKKRLGEIHQDHEFDVYISGTSEHLDALREAQSHHEDRRESLRMQHREVYDRFADIHNELDALSNELDRVTSHGVALEAHFNRFGYNANVRSYDDEDESPSASGSATPHSSMHEKQQSPCERGFATPLRLFKIPTLRQYFHNGILWRSAGSEEVQSFELFVDLLYVGILQINGDITSEDPTGLSLLHFVITFTLSYKIWNDMSLFISWFETDDVFQRVSILFLLACLFGYTTNIVSAFEESYATLIGFYLAARLFMGLYLLLCAYFIPMIRSAMILHFYIVLVGAGLWIASIHVAWPDQLALIWCALFVDVVGSIGYVWLQLVTHMIGGKAWEWFSAKFQVYPAINIEHRTERTNAFVSLVFGYTVVAILYQSAVNGIDSFYGKGILGLIQCFIFNWMYFEIDGSNLLMHAIRRQKMSAFAWSFAHLPFIMTFVLGGAGLSRLVIAPDSPNSHIDWLTETYQERAEHLSDHIPVGIRWFYCGGFGLALLFMALISISHIHREQEGRVRLTKKFRLIFRISVAVILICLPLAHSLDSLDLIGTVTGLLVLLLCLELWAASNVHDKLFGRTTTCQYFGNCGKKDLRAMLQGGKEVDIDMLIKDKNKNSGCTVGP